MIRDNHRFYQYQFYSRSLFESKEGEEEAEEEEAEEEERSCEKRGFYCPSFHPSIPFVLNSFHKYNHIVIASSRYHHFSPHFSHHILSPRYRQSLSSHIVTTFLTTYFHRGITLSLCNANSSLLRFDVDSSNNATLSNTQFPPSTSLRLRGAQSTLKSDGDFHTCNTFFIS